MKTRHLSTAASALIAALLTASGAFAGQQIRMETTQQSAEVIEDLGEIREAGGMTGNEAVKFRGSVGGRGDFTTNARLSGNHDDGDFLWTPSIEGGVNIQLGKGFTFDMAVKVESVFYSDDTDRNFAGYSAVATLDWRPKPNLPRLYIGAEPYRYDSYDTGDLLTQALGLTAGTDWGFAFNGGNSLAFGGYSFTQYLADPGIDDRHTHRGVVGITHQLRAQLYGQLIYAYQFTNFEIARDDSRHIITAAITYQFNRNLFGNISATFIDNDSSMQKASYQSAGGGIGLTWQF